MTSALHPESEPGAGQAAATASPGGVAATPKQKHSFYARDPHDFYVEPPFCAELLFEKIRFEDAVYDPACGIGTILEAAKGFCLRVSGSDIVDRGWPHMDPACDFLADETVERYQPPNIICNPPFKLAEAFARKAISIAYQKVAILVRLDFLAGQKRHALFTEHPPAWVLVLSRRPSMPPGELLLRGEAKQSGGQTDYCWVVWDTARPNRPTETRWLK